MNTVLLVYLGAIGLVYATLAAGLAALLMRWGGPRVVRPYIISTVISVVVFTVGVVLFEQVAFFFRHSPPGWSGLERQGADRLAYVFWARAAFFALYGSALVLSGAVGYVVGRRLGGNGRKVGGATAAALLLFMIMTIGIVDFANACFVGEPVVVESNC